MNVIDILELSKKHNAAIEFKYIGFGNAFRITILKTSQTGHTYRNDYQVLDADIFKDNLVELSTIIENMIKDIDIYMIKREKQTYES